MAKKTYTEHATGLADDARKLAEQTRDDIEKLRDKVQKRSENPAPEPYETPVYAATARLMSAVDDVDRTLDGIRQIAADLDRTAAGVTPPKD